MNYIMAMGGLTAGNFVYQYTGGADYAYATMISFHQIVAILGVAIMNKVFKNNGEVK